MKIFKRSIIPLIIIFSLATILYSQSRGTPSQLRVRTDAANSLLVASASQTLPLSQPTLFTNTRLATDANGNLLVVLSGGGAPTVTNHAYYIGTGTSSVTAIGPCTSTQVSHGVTGSDPVCAQIIEVDLGLTDITTANATSGLHGFLPKLSGNAYDFFLGDGTYGRTVARGTITTSSPWTFTQTWNAAGATFDAINLTVTNTASAAGSKYLTIANGTGEAFAIKKELTSAGGTDNIGLFINTWNTASSEDIALRTASGGYLNFTTSTNTNGRNLRAARINILQVTDSGQAKLDLVFNAGYRATNDMRFGWTSSAVDATSAFDTALGRNAASVVEVNNGTLGTFGDLRSRHLLGGGTAPAVTNTTANSCGTSAATLVGSDIAGKVTVGATSGTSCTITFTTAFTNAPACSVSDESTAVLTRATSTVSTVILAGIFTAGDVLAYHCLGY